MYVTDQRCSRCVLDSSIPNIVFDERGVCNFCHAHNDLEKQFPKDGVELISMIESIKSSNKNYDCIVGLSGGADSSYLLHLAKTVWKLRPLALHFDNRWNTDIANSNMEKLVSKLNVDYYKVGPAEAEFDDICKSFLKASVPDADIPNDIGMTASFYKTAKLLDIKTVLIGHSFRTEGSIPLGWTYMDGKYIQSVTEKFGTHKIDTFTNLWLKDWIHWIAVDKIKILRPFWYMNYDPERAKMLLKEKYDWQWYNNKHAENKYTKFIAYYYLYNKFNIDKRLVRLSAPVRSGFITRDSALETLSHAPIVEQKILDEIKSRLNLTDSKFNEIMHAEKNTHFDYETYQSTFHRYKPFFWLMYKLNLVPYTFYRKYCC